MKRFFHLSAMVACTALLVACGSDKEVKGNGQITTQSRDVPRFKKVSVKGDFNVMLVRRWPQKISVTADSNLQEHILTVVKDDELDIKPEKGYDIKPTQPIMIKIAARDLEKIKTKGTSKIDATGLNVNEFEFKSKGTSQASLSGRVDKADIEIDGAAKLNARNLMAKNVALEIDGAAQTQVHATKKLDVKIRGAAQVTYYGKPPVVNQAIFGGGKLMAAKQSS